MRVDRDRGLVDTLRRREPTAAERLVATYGDRAYRLATSITGSVQDAEEVVQDALWAVVRKIDMFRGESAFGSWVYRIVANAAYQKLRGRQSRRQGLRSTRCCRSSTSRAGTARQWPTGLRARTTRPSRPTCGWR